jgi:signal transduction histidine kinase
VSLEFAFAVPFAEKPRDVRIRLFSIESGGQPFGCLVLEDVSLQKSIERMKETLTALLLHDVKNPLTAAMLSLELLERGRNVDPATLEVLGAAHQCATTIELPDEPLACDVDGEVIRRAIDNLLDNAYRQSRPGQRVIVRAERNGSHAYVEVKDQGPGIPAPLRERIFDKFVRADATNAAGSNHGLGLTLVKLAAAAHGGDVSIECPQGGGTVFRVTLPLATTRDPAAPVPR